MNFDRKERLLFMMLCDIYKKLEIGNSFDPDLISNALMNGHDWAIDWEYGNALAEHSDSEHGLKETVDVLDMWGFVERGFDGLSDADKAKVEQALGRVPRFHGFDGNNEAEHYSIARFLVEKMGRFSEFQGRELNAHHQTLPRHLEALQRFAPIRGNLGVNNMSAYQIIEVLS